MIAHFLNRLIKYNGTQIYSRWAFKQAKIVGECIVAFIGPCNIPPKNIVDMEDLEKGAKIASPLMLHFIIEFFERNLEKAVLHQRLFTAIVKDILTKKTGRNLIRRGDDIYDGIAKLSISVATLTSISSKIHFGINIESHGTPVKTKGLKEYNIPPKQFAAEVMKAYLQEIKTMTKARYKVRSVS